MNSISDQLLLANGWAELFSGFEPGQRFALLIVGIGCGTGIILGLAGIIAGAVSSVYRRRVETEMKRELVERGLSADEITKIIECAAPPEDATNRVIASWACKKKTG